MNVNWQNLVTKIQNGQAAYDGHSFGTPNDGGNIGFYDQPMSDLSEGALIEDRLNPNVFIIGVSKWGSSSDTVKS